MEQKREMNWGEKCGKEGGKGGGKGGQKREN